MRRQILILLYISALFAPLSAQSTREVRASWVTVLGNMDWPDTRATTPQRTERQKKELIDILDRLKAAGINTVLLQTRVRGSVIYPSKIEPFTENISGRNGQSPGYDPLKFAINECHKRGMQLHAWVVAVPLGGRRVMKKTGSRSVISKQRDICLRYRGCWYLNPGHPGARKYLASIVAEIVDNYDIDGIHLDYIRYPKRISRFPDLREYKKYGHGRDKENWRRDNITEMVREVYKTVKQRKPWIWVSSAPLGKLRDTKRYSAKGWNGHYTVCQDVERWLKEGIQDMIFPMMYYRGNNYYPFALDWKEKSNGRAIVSGLGIWFMEPREQNWPLKEITREINFCRRAGLAGQAHYRNRFLLKDLKGLYSTLKNNEYRHPALMPRMTWIDSISPARPEDAGIHKGKLRWKSPTSNKQIRYNIYSSAHYPVDTEIAENLTATYIDGNSWDIPKGMNKKYFCITSIDRYGNESRPREVNISEYSHPLVLNKGNELLHQPLKDGRIFIVTSSDIIVRSCEKLDSQCLKGLSKGIYTVKDNKKTLGYIIK